MRDIAVIDEDIRVENELLKRDIRAGEHCNDAEATRERINRLLDERLDAQLVVT